MQNKAQQIIQETKYDHNKLLSSAINSIYLFITNYTLNTDLLKMWSSQVRRCRIRQVNAVCCSDLSF